MMPLRQILSPYLTEIAMTLLGILLMFTWSAVVGIIQISIFIFYWLPTIYHKSVKRYYGGSWRAWASQFNIFRIIKKCLNKKR